MDSLNSESNEPEVEITAEDAEFAPVLTNESSDNRRVAAVNFKLRAIRGDAQYFGHLHDLISEAHDEGADTVVLPELHVLELLSLHPDLRETKAPRFLAQYADSLEEWLQRISDNSGMTIIGGSHFRETPTGIRNVCAICQPGQPRRISEKNNLTRYEAEVWGLERGEHLAITENSVGVTVCYDSEFPDSGRLLAEQGVLIQAIPAWTETQRGFQRVRWSALARAVENQIFVIHASLVGGFDREPVPFSFGSSAIIAPSSETFPPDAILRESALNEEAVILADLNFEALEHARTASEVANWEDRGRAVWKLG